MKSLVVLFPLLAFATSAFSQKTPRTVEINTKLLYESCTTYQTWKARDPSALPQTAQEASAIGYCKGFFQAFALATGGAVTIPDESGHVQVLKYKDGLMLDELIGTFIDAARKNPNSLKQDGMDFLLLTILLRHLATFEPGAEVYVKKK